MPGATSFPPPRMRGSRKALICKQSIDHEYQGPGLGRRALLAALATAPDHEWTTTPQYDVSVRFWQRQARDEASAGSLLPALTNATGWPADCCSSPVPWDL
jgi:hypothetical protein